MSMVKPEELKALPDDTRKLLRILWLEIITNSAHGFGECPFCEVPIGAYNQHYVASCPFTQLAKLLENL